MHKKTKQEEETNQQAKRDLEEIDRACPEEKIDPHDPRLKLPAEDYAPTSADEDDEEFWKTVQAQEEAYEYEDEERKKAQAERRTKLLDDVPFL